MDNVTKYEGFFEGFPITLYNIYLYQKYVVVVGCGFNEEEILGFFLKMSLSQYFGIVVGQGTLGLFSYQLQSFGSDQNIWTCARMDYGLGS